MSSSVPVWPHSRRVSPSGEHYGMGVRKRIINTMREHNSTQPDLIAEDHRFTVRLHKAPLAPQSNA